jgi:hypothetical protein
VAVADDEKTAQGRIRRARETAAVLERVLREPTPENIVALHELHALHSRELGDKDAAARADERSDHARQPRAHATSSARHNARRHRVTPEVAGLPN